jgi:transcriptional regulator with XRE-family HTH domain
MPRSRRSPRQARLLELLAALRTTAGLTQAELALRLKRPQSFVSKYELAERRLDVVELLEVCAALDTDPQQVIKELLKVDQQ